MAKLEQATSNTGIRLYFYCPGCKGYHVFDSRWSWNNDLEKPTFSPSLLCDPNGDNRCHLFVRDGMIEFLADCHHGLAGQTVEMPDMPQIMEVGND